MLDRVLNRVRGGRGLARRIYFAFLVAAVIPTGIAGIIGVTLSLDQLREETLRHLRQEVSVRANGVSLFFDQLSAELRYLAEAPALSDMRGAIRQGDSARTAAATSRLERDYSALASSAELGWVPPKVFIPLAEKCGLIAQTQGDGRVSRA